MAKEEITFEDLKHRLDSLSDELPLAVGKAAFYLGVSESTLNHWRSDGTGPPWRSMGGGGKRGRVQYILGDLRKFSQSRIVNSAAEARLLPQLSRMCSLNPWSHKLHPFWERNGSIVDSILGEQDFKMLFENTETELVWMTISAGMASVWEDEALWMRRRGELLNIPGLDKSRLAIWKRTLDEKKQKVKMTDLSKVGLWKAYESLIIEQEDKNKN